jgi:hypothetical protein
MSFLLQKKKKEAKKTACAVQRRNFFQKNGTGYFTDAVMNFDLQF